MAITACARRRWALIGRAAGGAVMVCSLLACSGTDDRTAGEPDVEVASWHRWCAQLDELALTTARIDAMDPDDPDLDAAMAEVNETMSAFDDIPAPAAIADEWRLVSTPPTSDDTGSFDVGDAWEEAGDRIAAWALENCQLSERARQALDG